MRDYPKWIYHENGASKIVKDQQEHQAAGPGWYESPADAKVAASRAAQQPSATPIPTPTTETAPVQPHEPEQLSAPASMPATAPAAAAEKIEAVPDDVRRKAEAEAVYASPVNAIIPSLNGASLESLKQLKAIEEKNPKGPRASLLKVVEAKIAAFEAEAK